MIQLTRDVLDRLAEAGLECLHPPGISLPDDILFEPPCSIKWMHIQHRLVLGAFSYAVRGFYFNVEIGRYTSIGEDVQIGRGDHPTTWMSTSPAFYLQDLFRVGNRFAEAEAYHGYVPALPPDVQATRHKLTRIEHDVYIGHGAFIRPGVTIGTGAIVAARAVVVRDVPPYAVVAGNPAVVKKFRLPLELVIPVLKTEWWRFAPWQLKDIDMTSPEKALPRLQELGKNREAYAPGMRRITDFG